MTPVKTNNSSHSRRTGEQQSQQRPGRRDLSEAIQAERDAGVAGMMLIRLPAGRKF